jgi:hypothetical protein
MACALFVGAQALRAADPSPPFPDPAWPVSADWQQAVSAHAPPIPYELWLRSHAGDAWASIIIKHGYVVYEGAGPRSSLTEQNHCGSNRKVLQATVLGAALYQGKLKSIDENALPYWKDPFLTPYANDRNITFRQFAQYHDRWNEPEPPGTYHYNNSGATAGGACIAGLFQDVRGPRGYGIAEVVRREVMDKIHADWSLTYLDQDFTPGKSGDPGPQLFFRSSVTELAKLGYLWLNRGRWGDQRIFSEDFYREAVTDWSPHTGDMSYAKVGHYGYWWFLNDGKFWLPDAPEDAFYVIGNGDPKRATVLLVIPSRSTVAVLSMERLSDDGKWDVIQNSRVPSNEGPRWWSREVMKLDASLPGS